MWGILVKCLLCLVIALSFPLQFMPAGHVRFVPLPTFDLRHHSSICGVHHLSMRELLGCLFSIDARTLTRISEFSPVPAHSGTHFLFLSEATSCQPARAAA
mmetsp:Transcript_4848/g.15044  ORF Transcript_4848/g.15044 Transcript_4848/m.15044 type:complete len:101 (-) Transcript_4848:1822-2124(-)